MATNRTTKPCSAQKSLSVASAQRGGFVESLAKGIKTA
jgi:hypothetical protein